MKPNDSLTMEAAEEIRACFRGELRIDKTTQILYSTDASIYQVMPLGVAIPRDLDDLQAIVQVCSRMQISMTARGSGSSLAGQAIGEGIIIDCSRFLDRLFSIDSEEKTAWVQPGLILNRLNQEAGVYGLQFGPDPASGERASLGGSIGNNASGAHSINYGMAADHLEEVELVLSDGSIVNFCETSIKQAKIIAKKQTIEGLLYRAALEIREIFCESIQRNWPRTWRRASGYNINYLLPWSPSSPTNWEVWGGKTTGYPPVREDNINLAHLIAGSEGTLGVIRKMKLRLVSKPGNTILVLLAFSDSRTACQVIPEILEMSPTAIELIPQNLIRLASSVPGYSAQAALLKPLYIEGAQPPALLAVEFSGSDKTLLIEKAKKLETFAPTLLAQTAADQQKIWAVRKVGLGLFMSRSGASRPWSFIEDLSVPVDRLADFVAGIERLFSEFGVEAEMYGHASAGCLHIRPLINLKTVQGVDQMRRLAYEAVELTLNLGGAISGEHGDGLARTEWNERMFGKEITAAFRMLKNAADPDNILNPGKIVTSRNEIPPPRLDASLRFKPDLPIHIWESVLDFTKQGGMVGAIEQCNGAGVCRKFEGLMCPSFRATREEMHSTRGRANLLRAYLYCTSQERTALQRAVKDALDQCLACKGCKSECPSAVDVAKLKYEFYNDYYSSHRRNLRDFIFSYIEYFGRYAQPLWFAANPVINLLGQTGLQEGVFGIDRNRKLPRLARQSMTGAWRQISGKRSAANALEQDEERETILFLSDPFTEYFYPEIGLAALEVLLMTGFRVKILPIIGSGRMLISKGFLEQAKRRANRMFEAIAELDPKGEYAVVGVEPSETVTFADEYLELMPGREDVRLLAGNVWSVEEILARRYAQKIVQSEIREYSWIQIMRVAKYLLLSFQPSIIPISTNILLHEHCYQKSRPPHPDGLPVGAKASSEVLTQLGYAVTSIDAGCCGMAGAFGYEKEHFDVSMRVGEDRLFSAIRDAGPDTIICASGYSCRAQIEDGTKKRAYHPVEIIRHKMKEELNQAEVPSSSSAEKARLNHP